tara:strand:- start:148 stop:570 length:423 start_codon:yes stop_codon:yes gene_type:complete
MPKEIATIVKLTIPAGTANPAPPIGTALGPHGIQIMEFCNEFNAETKDQKGSLIPCVITIYKDRSFSFIIKKPPVSDMIKKTLGLDKASQNPGRESAGKLTDQQVEKVAQDKMPDLNTTNIEAAKRIVVGVARSMGIQIK